MKEWHYVHNNQSYLTLSKIIQRQKIIMGIINFDLVKTTVHQKNFKALLDTRVDLSKNEKALAVILSAMTVRYLVSLHPHSGESTPPMYGDYEAQRHWMEIAISVRSRIGIWVKPKVTI